MMKDMNRGIVSRRELLGGAAAAAAAFTIVPSRVLKANRAAAYEATSSGRSVFDGVHIGVITYNLRGVDGSAEGTLAALAEVGLSEVELMGGPIQSYLGLGGGRGGMGGGRGTGGGGRGTRGQGTEGAAPAPGGGPPPMGNMAAGEDAGPAGAVRGGAGAAGGRGNMGAMGGFGGMGGRGRQQTPPEPLTEEELQALNAERYEQLGKALDMRRMYNDAGVNIHLHKMNFGQRDEDIDFNFQIAKALGCVGITLERSEAMAERLAPFAEKHKIWVAFHNHTNNYPQLEDDPILNYGDWIGFNFDTGHYHDGSGGLSPIPIIEKYHDRIVSLHLKDKTAGGGNLPWGEGTTPICEMLRLVRDEKWPIFCDIELEYRYQDMAIPEVKKCLEYCKNCLA